MSKYTPIEWTNGTVNPTSGCDGCELLNNGCYAQGLHENRLARNKVNAANYAPDFREVRLIPGRMAEAAKWGPLLPAETHAKPWFRGQRRHIFISDMSDALSEAVPFEFLKAEIIDHVSSADGQRHVWQWLTKRPRRMAEFSRWLWQQGETRWPTNLWAGTSVTNQATADARIPELLQVPAAVRFLSCEPLRGALDLNAVPWRHGGMAAKGWSGVLPVANEPDDFVYWSQKEAIHWVIGGGESGPQANPTPLKWARSLRDQCQAAGVPFFWKQWGEWAPGTQFDPGPSWKGTPVFTNPDAEWRVGKLRAGRKLDGREWNELPKAA